MKTLNFTAYAERRERLALYKQELARQRLAEKCDEACDPNFMRQLEKLIAELEAKT